MKLGVVHSALRGFLGVLSADLGVLCGYELLILPKLKALNRRDRREMPPRPQEKN